MHPLGGGGGGSYGRSFSAVFAEWPETHGVVGAIEEVCDRCAHQLAPALGFLAELAFHPQLVPAVLFCGGFCAAVLCSGRHWDFRVANPSYLGPLWA